MFEELITPDDEPDMQIAPAIEYVDPDNALVAEVDEKEVLHCKQLLYIFKKKLLSAE